MEVTTMVAATESTWEEISSPDFFTPARQGFRDAVAVIADRARARL